MTEGNLCNAVPEEEYAYPGHCLHIRATDQICCWCGDLFELEIHRHGLARGRAEQYRQALIAIRDDGGLFTDGADITLARARRIAREALEDES